ncbi:GTP-binding protein Der [Kosmotoga arenicorallina S304]|uniref:GTPase Der n=1 Tax=Kosmotoga arenicorallina S304 TaxID=1453497 RepID=A0A176JXN6_9BACT|nr:ribosome biogenesis GTPase Der [Kosmotoga arenicorallina]OAA28471.1 GTP-binding protein Der [Kosmotoga arenicorallina S304]
MSTVLIVGRPNVGKSTLFNRLVGGKKAIVDDLPGVTRDFVFGRVEWQQKSFEIVDTCGLFDNPKDIVEEKMRDLTLDIIDDGDLILWVVDGKQGLTAADYELADFLRRYRERIILVANKVENEANYEINVKPELYSLGFGEPIPISADHGLNIDILLEEIIKTLQAHGHYIDFGLEPEETSIRVAIVGKPNAGKSSLFNAIVGSQRSLVTDLPGTTRDTVDETLLIDDTPITFVDTAGIRKKSRVKVKNVEYYSVMRAIDAIERSDIIVLVIDATQGISNQDQRIAGLAEKNGKGIIVVFNKTDLIDDRKINGLLKAFEFELYFVDYSPIIFTSAITGKGIDELIDKIFLVSEKIDYHIPTGLLNNLIGRFVSSTPPVGTKVKKAKIYYATQINKRPPLILLNVNDPRLFNQSYLRGLKRTIRENIDPLEGTPIFIKLRRKK